MRQRRSEIRAGGKQRDGRHRDAIGHAVVKSPIAALVNLRQSRPRTSAPRRAGAPWRRQSLWRSEEHTSELQSLMRISYAVFCLQKKTLIYKQNSRKQL